MLTLIETGSGVKDATASPGGELRVTIFPGASHTLLVVGLFWFETTAGLTGAPIESATYKGVTGVRDHTATAAGGRRRQVWRFQGNFDSISADVVFSNSSDYDGSVAGVGVAAAFTGEDAIPIGNFSSGTGTSSTPSRNVNGTLASSQVWDILGVDWTTTVPGTRTPGAGQTDRVGVTVHASGDLTNWLSGDSSSEPGNGGTVTMSWTLSTSKTWGLVAYEVFEAENQVLLNVPIAVEAKGPQGVTVRSPAGRFMSVQDRGAEAIGTRLVSQAMAGLRVASGRAVVKFGSPVVGVQARGAEYVVARLLAPRASFRVTSVVAGIRVVGTVPVAVGLGRKVDA